MSVGYAVIVTCVDSFKEGISLSVTRKTPRQDSRSKEIKWELYSNFSYHLLAFCHWERGPTYLTEF